MSKDELFSERMGFKPKKSIQYNDMDKELRIDLWNVFYSEFIEPDFLNRIGEIKADFLRKLWSEHLHRSLHTIPIKESKGGLSMFTIRSISEFQDLFYYNKWYEVYDLLEYSVKNYPYNDKQAFVQKLNSVLERNNSAYRFVGDTLTPIVEKEEIKEIETALDNPIESVKSHIKTALEHFSDKENPDYRNAIKEAITAVESLAKIISNMPGATLAPALDQTFKILNINNEKLKEAFKNLFGYTNTEGGIRHGSIAISNPGVEDARFIIITCSAFINYLIEKADKAGINYN